MKKYQKLIFRILKFDQDIVTASDGDNVGGANGNWSGWLND